MNIRLSAPFRLILAALLVLSLQACATRGTEIGTSAPSDASNAAWQAYQGYASARASDHDPYRLSGSLRYGSQGDTRRVETLLWSNGYLPIRLDVMAGIGALVADVRPGNPARFGPQHPQAQIHDPKEFFDTVQRRLEVHQLPPFLMGSMMVPAGSSRASWSSRNAALGFWRSLTSRMAE